MITRTANAGRWFVRCDVCLDFIELHGTGAYFDADERWFAARHRHEVSDLPPSMEPKPKKRSERT